MNRYFFKEIVKCEMCGETNENHIILGQRMNQSQGFRPKKKIGITVSIQKCTNCNCDCHCDGDIHGDVYGACTCENCKCREVKNEPEGLVVDETGECESCQ